MPAIQKTGSNPRYVVWHHTTANKVGDYGSKQEAVAVIRSSDKPDEYTIVAYLGWPENHEPTAIDLDESVA